MIFAPLSTPFINFDIFPCLSVHIQTNQFQWMILLDSVCDR